MAILFTLRNLQSVIMPQQPYSPDLEPADFFLFPKLKTPFFYDWVDKRKIETGAVGDTKKHVSEVLRQLEQMLA